MNSACLLMTAALTAGGQPPVQPPAVPAIQAPAQPPPAVIAGGGGCGSPGCGGAMYAPAAGPSRPTSLLGALKGRKGGGCCETYSAPAASCCDDGCGGKKGGFFDRFKGRMGGHKHAADCCDTCGPVVSGCAGCGAPAIVGAPGAPAVVPPGTVAPENPPVTMPPKTTNPPTTIPKKTEKPAGESGAAITIPSPITPVGGPKLNGATSPY